MRIVVYSDHMGLCQIVKVIGWIEAASITGTICREFL